MSTLVQAKITEARQLLEQAHTEETEGSLLAQQIQQLTSRSAGLLTSAREKRVIATSQLQAAESLGGDPAADVPATQLTPAKKRGGRPKGSVAVAAAAPAVVAVTAKAKTKGVKAAKAAGEKVARVPAEKGQLPPLHERLKIVIGQDSVTIAEAIERLKAHDKSWIPDSEDLKAYISLSLSTHTKDLFDRVQRGVYRVKKGGSASPKGGVKKAAVAAKNGAQPAVTNGSNGSEDFGSNILDNPFSGAEAAA